MVQGLGFRVLASAAGFRFRLQLQPVNLFSQTLYTSLAIDYITYKQTTRGARKQDGMGRKSPRVHIIQILHHANGISREEAGRRSRELT
jgi:hypothetical protein